MMDSKLITFITVAGVKSYTRASSILNITQPAVSQHIRFLEEYYGVRLIRKKGRGIELTEEGNILLKQLKEIERLYNGIEDTIKNQGSIKRTYNVGATMTIGGYVLPNILGQYKTIHNNIDIILHVNNTEEVINMLLKGSINLAIVEGNFDRDRFRYKKMRDDELVLAAAPLNKLAQKGIVKIDDVLSGKLILREKGSGTREIFENKLLDMGYDLDDINPYMEIGSIDAIKAMVEANLGYTIISKETIKREVSQRTIEIVPIKGIRILREFNFIYLDDGLMDFIDEFIRFCMEE